jgi:iron(III) transport system permease protein
MAFPGIVLGLALLWTYLKLPLPIYGTMWILLLVTITRRLPYASRTSSSVLLQLSPEFEEASQVTGVNWWHTFRRIVWPLAAPGITSAWFLLYILTLRETSSVVLLYSHGTEILPIVLLDLWTEGVFTQVAAMTCLQLLLMFASWALASRLLRSPLKVVG